MFLADDDSRCRGNSGDEQCKTCQRLERNEQAIHWYVEPYLVDGVCVHKIEKENYELKMA